MKRGQKAVLAVVLVTAAVMTPLVIVGILLGFYVGGQVGYSGSVLSIAFSTAGFIGGLAIVFRVIGAVVAWSYRASS